MLACSLEDKIISEENKKIGFINLRKTPSKVISYTISHLNQQIFSRDNLLVANDEGAIKKNNLNKINSALESIISNTDIAVLVIESENNYDPIDFYNANKSSVEWYAKKFADYKGIVVIDAKPTSYFCELFRHKSGLDDNQVVGFCYDKIKYLQELTNDKNSYLIGVPDGIYISSQNTDFSKITAEYRAKALAEFLKQVARGYNTYGVVAYQNGFYSMPIKTLKNISIDKIKLESLLEYNEVREITRIYDDVFFEVRNMPFVASDPLKEKKSIENKKVDDKVNEKEKRNLFKSLLQKTTSFLGSYKAVFSLIFAGTLLYNSLTPKSIDESLFLLPKKPAVYISAKSNDKNPINHLYGRYITRIFLELRDAGENNKNGWREKLKEIEKWNQLYDDPYTAALIAITTHRYTNDYAKVAAFIRKAIKKDGQGIELQESTYSSFKTILYSMIKEKPEKEYLKKVLEEVDTAMRNKNFIK